jgi:O-succinylbenzoic acid--CoA ligase
MHIQINDFIEGLAQQRKAFIKDETRQITFIEFSIHIRKLQLFLSQQGLSKGDRVLFPMRNNIEHAELFLACIASGAIVFVTSPKSIAMQWEYLNSLVKPHWVITDAAHAEIFTNQLVINTQVGGACLCRTMHIHEQLDPVEEEASVGIFTSGSTGEPKAVMHSFKNLLLNAKLHTVSIGLKPNMTVGCFLPLNFSYGLVANFLAPLSNGNSIVLAKADGLDFNQWLTDNLIHVTSTTPYTASRLHQLGISSNLCILTIGGDVCHPALGRNLLSTSKQLRLYCTYGLTEAGPRVATYEVSSEQLASEDLLPLGRALEGVELSLIGNESSGELVVKTPTAMLGYFRDPLQSKDVKLEPKVIRTFDTFTRQGSEFYFMSRNKRIISRGGEKIYPVLIEGALRGFADILEAWVEPLPHAEYGQIPMAYIVPQPGKVLEIRYLLLHLRKHLPASHIPDKFNLVSELPAHAVQK